MPKFSVVTCTLNSEDYILRNIASVNAQNCDHELFEYIVIDGNSSDATLKIISENMPGAKIFNYPPAGISHAMNMGTKHASGEYIIHLHSDDYFADETILKDTAEFLEQNNNPPWIYGQIIYRTDGGNDIGVFPTKKLFRKYSFPLMFFYNYIPHQAVFIRREILEEASGFDMKYNYLMDYALWLKLGSEKIFPMYFDRKCAVYSRRKNQKSHTSNMKDTIKESFMLRRQSGGNSIFCLFAGMFDEFIRYTNRSTVFLSQIKKRIAFANMK